MPTIVEPVPDQHPPEAILPACDSTTRPRPASPPQLRRVRSGRPPGSRRGRVLEADGVCSWPVGRTSRCCATGCSASTIGCRRPTALDRADAWFRRIGSGLHRDDPRCRCRCRSGLVRPRRAACSRWSRRPRWCAASASRTGPAPGTELRWVHRRSGHRRLRRRERAAYASLGMPVEVFRRPHRARSPVSRAPRAHRRGLPRGRTGRGGADLAQSWDRRRVLGRDTSKRHGAKDSPRPSRAAVTNRAFDLGAGANYAAGIADG